MFTPLSLTYGLRAEDNSDNKILSNVTSRNKSYLYTLNYLIDLTLSIFDFDGNFDDFAIPKQNVNSALMLNGAVAFCSSEKLSKAGFKLIAFPFSINKFNIYGEPQEIKIEPFYDSEDFKNFPIYNMTFENTKDKKEFEIVYAKSNKNFNGFLPQATYTALQISQVKQMCENNVIANSLPIFVEGISEQINSIDNLVNLIYNQNGIVKIDKSKGVRAEELIKIINNNVPWLSDRGYMFIRDLLNDFYREIGIKNVAYEKKERVNTEEVKSLDQVTDVVAFSMLKSIKKGLDKVNTWIDADFTVKSVLNTFDKLSNSGGEIVDISKQSL